MQMPGETPWEGWCPPSGGSPSDPGPGGGWNSPWPSNQNPRSRHRPGAWVWPHQAYPHKLINGPLQPVPHPRKQGGVRATETAPRAVRRISVLVMPPPAFRRPWAWPWPVTCRGRQMLNAWAVCANGPSRCMALEAIKRIGPGHLPGTRRWCAQRTTTCRSQPPWAPSPRNLNRMRLSPRSRSSPAALRAVKKSAFPHGRACRLSSKTLKERHESGLAVPKWRCLWKNSLHLYGPGRWPRHRPRWCAQLPGAHRL